MSLGARTIGGQSLEGPQSLPWVWWCFVEGSSWPADADPEDQINRLPTRPPLSLISRLPGSVVERVLRILARGILTLESPNALALQGDEEKEFVK